MDKGKQDQLEQKFKKGLDQLHQIDIQPPSLEAITQMVHDTKRKQRNELYLFCIVALFLSFCTVAVIVNLPVVYVTVQSIVFVLLGIGAVIHLTRSGVKQHE